MMTCLENANAPIAVKAAFPTAWGAPPSLGTADARELPGGYGSGSTTLALWIAAHMASFKETGVEYPPAWGARPTRETRDHRSLPFGYGHGSGTLLSWISSQAAENGADLSAWDAAVAQTANVNTWPHLVGTDGASASSHIWLDRPGLNIQTLSVDDFATADFREDRVRVRLDSNGKVATEPKVG